MRFISHEKFATQDTNSDFAKLRSRASCSIFFHSTAVRLIHIFCTAHWNCIRCLAKAAPRRASVPKLNFFLAFSSCRLSCVRACV